MGEQRTSRLKRILQRVEEHVEDWRKRDAALSAEADAMRGQMWAEAAERERLLAEAMKSEEDGRAPLEDLTEGDRGGFGAHRGGEGGAGRGSIVDLTKEHRVVFVLHREEVVETLEDLASQGDRLVSVVPRKGGEAVTAGLKGAWLVFEKSE